jgi:hypothetical protein
MEESARAILLLLAARFSDAEHVSLQAIGQRALKDNTFFLRIGGGSGFNVRTYDRLVAWFSENWPNRAEWPAQIERPALTQTEVAAECEAATQ